MHNAVVRPSLRWVRRWWLVWLVVVSVLAVGSILWAAVVEPSWLLPDTQGLSAADRVKAQTDLRNTLVTMLGGFAVFIGGAAAATNVVFTQRVQWRAQVTERFSKAIEQLGQSEEGKLDVRLGAVYALEQIAKDSEELHWPIMEVLTAYLREHSRWVPADDREEPTRLRDAHRSGDRPSADVQAIATVIGRRRVDRDRAGQRLDLHSVDLRGVQWSEAHLEGALLREAHLEQALLVRTHLERADLGEAHLEGAFLHEARLEGADLFSTYPETAKLNFAHLEGARLVTAHLKWAELDSAHLERADLFEAHLDGTRLREAHLKGTSFLDADLTRVEYMTWSQLRWAKDFDLALVPPDIRQEAERELESLRAHRTS